MIRPDIISRRLLSALTALAISVLACTAQTTEAEDDNDEAIRLAPELDAMRHVPQASYESYPFLNLAANRIEMNGADWKPLAEMFVNSGDTVVSVVHIGDSHIQAEGSTTRIRSLLQKHYGSAGRGLIIPFSIAGTNQPLDYKITSPSAFTSSKLLKQPWPTPMGFTGIALQPSQRDFSFTISVDRREGSEPDFNIIRVHAGGKMPSLEEITDEHGNKVHFSDFTSGNVLEIFIYEPVTECTLHFKKHGECQIFGFQLENQMTGIEYSAIGNNGATYSCYNGIPDFGSELARLTPALVIISLGTNEAFGKTTKEMISNNIDLLVKDIRRHCPQAELLLTTPAECQRTRYTGRGKRRSRSRTYSINPNVAVMRQAIIDYAQANAIPVYDFYSVAGGQNSSNLWHSHGLMGKDHIHYTWTGYELMGSLLFDALHQAIINLTFSHSDD